mmetsp:Transcript_105193/g.302501  ORF Transcript_105193/g.302501 Transcript_105193/m.302501 type:complete len:287 (+) Transcript_105193:96-956(+)
MGGLRRGGAAPSVAAVLLLALAVSFADAVALAGAGRRGQQEPPADPKQAQDAAALASAAAREAWAAAGEVKAAAEANMKYIPMAQAQVDMAKVAAETAAEKDKELTVYLEEVRAQVDNSALQAATSYMARVKAEVESHKAKAAEYLMARNKGEDDAVAKTAAEAAKPYNAMLLRGQKVSFDYAKRAQELAAASNHLRVEGMNLARSADAYQQAGQGAQANQIMVTAHNLMTQGLAMQREAVRLQKSAQEIRNALPIWQQAEQAAVMSAAEEFHEKVWPDLPLAPLN